MSLLKIKGWGHNKDFTEVVEMTYTIDPLDKMAGIDNPLYESPPLKHQRITNFNYASEIVTVREKMVDICRKELQSRIEIASETIKEAQRALRNF